MLASWARLARIVCALAFVVYWFDGAPGATFVFFASFATFVVVGFVCFAGLTILILRLLCLLSGVPCASNLAERVVLVVVAIGAVICLRVVILPPA